MGTPFFKTFENARKNAALGTDQERNENAALKQISERKQERRSQNYKRTPRERRSFFREEFKCLLLAEYGKMF